MAFLDKLMFWRRKDDFDLGLDTGPKTDAGFMDAGLGRDREIGLGYNREAGFGGFEEPQTTDLGHNIAQPGFMQQPSQFQQPFQSTPHQPQPQFHTTQSTNEYIISKNIEVLSSKLDALRAGIESINQRLANLERIASGEHEERRRGW